MRRAPESPTDRSSAVLAVAVLATAFQVLGRQRYIHIGAAVYENPL
jgi:hypothetical protein